LSIHSCRAAAFIDDSPTEAEAAGSGTEVTPVAQRRDGAADDGGGFGDGEQVEVLAVIGCSFSVV
jgi:hypothetical protein